MLIGDMDASGWTIVIAAIVVGLTTLINTTATAVVFVRQRMIAKDVRKIELATNSMKDALVKKAGEEGEARGGMEERARADAREIATDARTHRENQP